MWKQNPFDRGVRAAVRASTNGEAPCFSRARYSLVSIMSAHRRRWSDAYWTFGSPTHPSMSSGIGDTASGRRCGELNHM